MTDRDRLRDVKKYNCDCLNAAPDGTPTDENGVYCQRWVYLVEDIEAALAAPVVALKYPLSYDVQEELNKLAAAPPPVPEP
jgi:hypothetical protein